MEARPTALAWVELRATPGRRAAAFWDGGEPRVWKWRARRGFRALFGRIWLGDGARREARALADLDRRGLPVPRALELRTDGCGEVLLLEGLPHEMTLRAALPGMMADERRRRLGELLGLVLDLHRAGYAHRDLYLQHVVCVSSGRLEGRLALLDLGRAKRTRRLRWRAKDLAALLLWAPEEVSSRDRWRFLVGWRAGLWPAGEGPDLRRLGARILARAAAMGRHRPRHGGESPGGWPGGWPLGPADRGPKVREP